ncbi:tropomyosin alpha-4 chain-like [Alligator mississippiensis]|uniref:tropomyosin alpha-4 chain-like n=1 Tax=Alligator mississippiensis TaxID=8496 RepID=UPI0028774741|nr:tropomyosin alpha-4 chain-like [Alligator mississippiensis]
MAAVAALEGRWQEAFTWQLRVDEAEEKAAHLELELEMMKSKKEQAEAKVAALELRVQPGKKEDGSKEIKRLIAAEAEKTRALERLMAEEAKKSRQQEEKLREMQKEMAEWRRKSPEPDMDQIGEQKEVMQKLEISKSLIGALQKEVHSQVAQIESLLEDLENWQE